MGAVLPLALGSCTECRQPLGATLSGDASGTGGEMDPMNSLTGLSKRARQFGDAMLRLTGLDDASMDLENSRLRDDLNKLEAEHAVAPTPRGYIAKITASWSRYALKRAWGALRAAERLRP